MQKKISLRLLPSETHDESLIKKTIADTCGKPEKDISGFHILKQSIDARGKAVWINLTVNAFIREPFQQRTLIKFNFKDVSSASKKVVIIGAGPAGLFAALKLIEQGIKPVLLERGKDVRARRRDLAILNKDGKINPESNYCFGEGGAGTYSDGKLYTRSNKRGNIDRILHLFVHFGAEEKVLFESHPHIGTNKLPHIISAMRHQIIDSGGHLFFEKKVTDLLINDEKLSAVKTENGDVFNADAFILATGHSARDIFTLLHSKDILIHAKPFALGVRIEHHQSLINTIQYSVPAKGFFSKQEIQNEFLPPATYSLAEQINNRGVFSFCMCPGGIIAPAATNNNEVVVNGWSPSKRNNPFANSGMVVQVEIEDAIKELRMDKEHRVMNDKHREIHKEILLKANNHPLLLMHFQERVEHKAFEAGGGNFIAPAQRMVDFCDNKVSSSLPACSYLPGISSADITSVLPGFISKNLQNAFKIFGKKLTGYYTNEAVIVATESRTSSPVRIPRDEQMLNHPQIKNLYPCGEGAGYAGGIVSAAMDGEKVANKLAEVLVK